jgi:hypothetical protein
MAKDNIDQEDEYFHRLEREKLTKLKASATEKKAEEDAAERKALHFHHCGKCGSKMDTTSYKGVEIEVCPGCGAVLLDPGELQQLAGEDESGFFKALSHFFQMS